jgi:histidinol-phosphatase
VSPDLELALRLADAADAISLPRFRTGLAFETKADLTPVTEADRTAESELRALLAKARPRDAILGEEEGATGGGGRRWILDPIDGTRNYARGIPVWATLVALEDTGEVRVGVVSAPALGRRWWAERGEGAFADGGRIGVSSIARIEDAVLSFAYENPIPALARRAWHARGLGDFWPHMLVAEGAVDGCVDAVGVKEWDLAAVQVIVEEAGGTFTDLEGVSRIDGRSAVTSNGLLHDELLASVARTAGAGGSHADLVAQSHKVAGSARSRAPARPAGSRPGHAAA